MFMQEFYISELHAWLGPDSTWSSASCLVAPAKHLIQKMHNMHIGMNSCYNNVQHAKA